MTGQISTLGWVLIILLVLLIISLNVGLITRSRGKRSNTNWINSLRDAGQVLKDPFRDENARIQELGAMVDRLKQSGNSQEINTIGDNESGEKK